MRQLRAQSAPVLSLSVDVAEEALASSAEDGSVVVSMAATTARRASPAGPFIPRFVPWIVLKCSIPMPEANVYSPIVA